MLTGETERKLKPSQARPSRWMSAFELPAMIAR
jgi:hypothetical protein